ncbi:MAG: 4Fe-4S binding protein, partial [Dehalococcoidia bacterium]|nr:4Fe-4S binding protein [Dehalococcoidia bacterium]
MVKSLVQEKIVDVNIPENTQKTLVQQAEVQREIKPAPPRYRNELAKYIIRRSDDCTLCGKCAEVCPQGVHILKPGYKYFTAPHQHVCVGPSCQGTDHYCVDLCPQKALQMMENPMMKLLGDYRWTSDMILATWKMAETGEPPASEYDFQYECGNSGGGFDRIRFKFPEKPPVELSEEEIDTSLELN